MRKIIGLSGLAGSGKSEVAAYLEREHGFQRIRFAGPLKAMCRAFGLSDDEIEGTLKETPRAILCGKTPRYFMQTLGTEFGRNLIGSSIWVNAWRTAVERTEPDAAIVVEDVRFPDEVAAIESASPFHILIRIHRGKSTIAGTHVSEIQTFHSDATIINGGTLVDLFTQIDQLVLAAGKQK